jgi:hypothetical protein
MLSKFMSKASAGERVTPSVLHCLPGAASPRICSMRNTVREEV